MPRLKLTLAYQGTHFSGWQIQARERTVQGELETAVKTLTGQNLRVHASGRTDSGVHAIGQVAHLDIPEDKTRIAWQNALNSVLPDDVAVTDAQFVPQDFHARYSAKAKVYAYTLWTEPGFTWPQRRPFAWPVGNLDFQAMDRAADLLTGEHDFTAFQNVGTDIKETVRTVYEFYRRPGATPHETEYVVRANGFLKQMVRNMIGCLVEIGRGKLNPETVTELLASGDRTKAPATAPAKGLTLISVQYD